MISQRPVSLQQSEYVVQIYKNIVPWLCLMTDDMTAVDSHQANRSRAIHYSKCCQGFQ